MSFWNVYETAPIPGVSSRRKKRPDPASYCGRDSGSLKRISAPWESTETWKTTRTRWKGISRQPLPSICTSIRGAYFAAQTHKRSYVFMHRDSPELLQLRNSVVVEERCTACTFKMRQRENNDNTACRPQRPTVRWCLVPKCNSCTKAKKQDIDDLA